VDRVIFFDIDNTIFDREKFLYSFYVLLNLEFRLSEEEVLKIMSSYSDIKEEFGYFADRAFLTRIYENLPRLSGKLDYYFEAQNLQNFLFTESQALFGIKNARIGIFSMGDTNFQKAKISRFKNILEEDLVYIFHNKLEKVSEVIRKHKDSKIYFVDDHADVLVSAKDFDSSVVTLLIDREKRFTKVNGIDFKLDSLFDIIPILNENS
jgi:hypothetical protein